jgi:tetratricopeptide (TPR) repeat protein
LTSPYDRPELTKLATLTPAYSIARINAVIHFIVHFVQAVPDPSQAQRWLREGEQALAALRSDGPERAITVSRFHRAAAMVPMLTRDHSAMHRHMDIAEEQARAALEAGPTGLLPRENLYSLLESRTKETLLVGDYQRAERYARELHQLTPLDAKSLIELGEVLVRQDRLEEAQRYYLRAAQVAPPGEGMAWFMAGQCAASLGDRDWARHCMAEAVHRDPLGVSAYRSLGKLNQPGSATLYADWAEQMLPMLAAT